MLPRARLTDKPAAGVGHTVLLAADRGTPVAPGRAAAITGVRLYATPEAPRVDGASVVIRGARIVEVRPDGSVPAGVPRLDLPEGVLVAGFWNTHVHFTEPKWGRALRGPPDAIAEPLADMLTSRGFTHAVDTGSDPRVTIPLRMRVERGVVPGPRILTAGPSIFPPKGMPYYVRDSLPFYLRWLAPTPRTPAAAARAVRRHIGWGADLIKIFTGSYVARGQILPMPDDIAAAAVEAAHAAGRLVFTHPSSREGVEVALRAGVDVLAHAPDSTEGVGDELLRQVVGRRMTMIPTLKMFATTVRSDLDYLGPIYNVVRRFHSLGGSLMFGTDVGYMTDYATRDEFQALAAAGLDWREMLRMLTTTPAARFGQSTEVGSVEPGKLADLVLLGSDPADSPTAFADVRATLRGGQLLWRHDEPVPRVDPTNPAT